MVRRDATSAAVVGVAAMQSVGAAGGLANVVLSVGVLELLVAQRLTGPDVGAVGLLISCMGMGGIRTVPLATHSTGAGSRTLARRSPSGDRSGATTLIHVSSLSRPFISKAGSFHFATIHGMAAFGPLCLANNIVDLSNGAY
jgi:hypothetical protein